MSDTGSICVSLEFGVIWVVVLALAFWSLGLVDVIE